MEREKALDMALGQIEKQYGKGAVMRMDEQAKVKIATIPTGALSLDLALGIGGLPRGRVVEVYGPEGSGKCLVGDTYVWTDRGMETVAELFERCGQKARCTSRVTDIRPLGVRAVNECGELEQVAALTHNHRRPVLRLRLTSGRTVSVTHNHPLRVVNEDGCIVWRHAGQITAGDTVVSAAFGAVEAAGGDGLSEDEAAAVGYLVAEGSLSHDTAVHFTTRDHEVGDDFTRLMEGLFDAQVRCYDRTEYAAYGKALRTELAERYGLDHVSAAGKRVPHCVRTAGHKVQRAFLAALFDGGWSDTSSTVGLGTASGQLAREVQLMLYGFGIPATVSSTFTTTSERGYWEVSITPASVHRFLDEVGFRSARRHAQVAGSFRRSALDPQPVQERYTYEQVTAVEDGGEQPTFDIMLPDTHSFIANGVLSHNTTVALHAIAEAQKAGGIAAFIDAEHALDPSYASALGVDIEALLVSQPDNGEQALEIADMLIRSNAIDILVVDSVAALTPRAEIEGEMGDSHVGLQARLMSQALRKLAGTLNRSRTCAVFVNQIREKIGVLFGCFSYCTRVTLADGTQEKIGEIVNQRMDVEVLSYDPDLGRIVPRRVVNWFDNGPTEEFLNVVVARGGKNGRAQFSCTPNHQVRTPGGWREAQELLVGDRVMQAAPHYLSELQWEVLLGGLMGDAALSPTRSGHGARLRWGHREKQVTYGDWKASLFANVGVSRSTNAKGAVFHDVQPLPELAELRDAVHIGGKKVLSHEYLKRLTPLALAIWYMDDGGFTLRTTGEQERTQGGSGRVEICVAAFEPSSRLRLADHLRDTWGISVRLIMKGRRKVPILLFPESETAKFHALIAPYVHPSMEYKLLPRYRGQFHVEPVFAERRYELMAMPITSIERKPRPQPERTTRRYDLEVEGTHNYFADGVMVHNSPETQPGGRALKFYSSVRLDVRRIESLKDGTDFVGNRVRVKVVKNKCVAAGTRVFDPTTGVAHAIEDIVDRGEGSAVWAADKRGELHVRSIGARMDQGQQKVIGLALGDGTELRVTPDHRILTELGWRAAGELAAGDRVARPRRSGNADGEAATEHPPGLLTVSQTEPVVDRLHQEGITSPWVARVLGLRGHEAHASVQALLGGRRLRRDRVEALAQALDSAFLREVLSDELFYDPIVTLTPPRWERTFDLEVDELHNFVADDVIVHNCAPPFRQAEFDILFGEGISKEGSVLDVGVDEGIVKKAGAWYTYDGEQLGQGRENARKFLKEHGDVCDEIYKKVTEALGLVPTDVTGTDGKGADAVDLADPPGAPAK